MNAIHKAGTFILGAAILIASGQARAQTVGELLDKGGQKLDATATKAIVSTGVVLRGRTPQGFEGSTVYKADGTLTASGTRPSDNRSNSGTGTWSVDDGGKVCTSIQWNGGGTGGGCHFWFKQGDDYYTAQTDNRDQRAVKRDIPK